MNHLNNESRRLYSCRSQKSPTCVTLDFPVDGYQEVTNCDVLHNIYNNFVIEHQFFCQNMNQTNQDLYCINIAEYPTDCFVNIGQPINLLYAKNNEICFVHQTILENITFNNITNNDYIASNITNYCNINLAGEYDITGLIIILIAFGMIFGLFCCICCCYKVHYAILKDFRKQRMRRILNTRYVDDI